MKTSKRQRIDVIPLVPSVATEIRDLAIEHKKSVAEMANIMLRKMICPSIPLEENELADIANIPMPDDMVWGKVKES